MLVQFVYHLKMPKMTNDDDGGQTLAQMVGGKHTEAGVEGGRPLLKGLPVRKDDRARRRTMMTMQIWMQSIYLALELVQQPSAIAAEVRIQSQRTLFCTIKINVVCCLFVQGRRFVEW